MPLVLLLSLMLLACQQVDNATQSKVGVVDMGRLMRDSEPGKAGLKFLETLQGDVQTKLNAVQQRLEANPKDVEAQKELQSLYMSAQQRLQAEQQNVVNLLNDTIQRVLNAYRTEKGYVAIVATDVVPSFDSKIDVTNDVLAVVNTQKVEFKSVAPEGEKVKPAAAPAAPQGDAAQPADPKASKAK